MSDLISIHEAAERGIERLREPQWADPLDHLKIDLLPNGRVGPWVHLYSPFNQECNGRDPVDILFMEMDCQSKDFIPYEGPLPESAEYQEKVTLFKGCLNTKGES